MPFPSLFPDDFVVFRHQSRLAYRRHMLLCDFSFFLFSVSALSNESDPFQIYFTVALQLVGLHEPEQHGWNGISLAS